MNDRNTQKVRRQSVFSRISAYLGSSVKNGFFGFLMSSYDDRSTAPKERGFVYKKVITPVKTYISRAIDSSVLMNVFAVIKRYLLACRLRVFGTFFFSFGLYSALLVLFRHFIIADGTAIESVVFPLIVALSSLPLLASNKTLSVELLSSKLGRNVRDYTGFRRETMETDRAVGRSNVAFALGLLLGMATISVSPAKLLFGIAVIVYGSAVLATPEVGVVSLFFLVPWISARTLACLIVFIAFALLVKVIRGKRALRFERVDLTVAIFGVLIILAGLIPGGKGAMSQASVYTLYLLGYFVAVSTLRNRQWFARAVYSAVSSAALIAVYSAVAYVVPLVSDAYLIDSPSLTSFFDFTGNMFGDARALSGYFVFIFPLAVGSYMSSGMKAGRRFACFIVSLLIIACTAIDLSLGVIAALVISIAIILAVRNHNFVYIFIVVVAVLPVLAAIFPETTAEVFRFLVPESVYEYVEYVLRVWNGTAKMIGDYFVGGIGLGEDAWREVYSRYAVGTVSDAPHSYSLYLQILSTLGVFGLASFVLAIVSVYRTSFTCLLRKSSFYEMKSEPETDSVKRIIKRDYVASKTETASAIAAVASALIAGITNNIWSDYRLFFMFWLVVALAVGNARAVTGEVDITAEEAERIGKTEAELTISLS